MADIVRGGKLSTGTLGMRFMQRKAAAELVAHLEGAKQQVQSALGAIVA